jgi:autotransporter-associated beta strand protein
LGLNGDGTVTLGHSNNTFSGGLDMHGFGPGTTTLSLEGAQSIPNAPVLDLDPDNTLRMLGATQSLAGLTGSGLVDMTAIGNLLFLNGSGDTTFGGTIMGTGVIDHTGTGHQTFTGASTYNGILQVTHGIVTVSGGAMPASVTVGSGASLSLTGHGTTGSINVGSGGMVQLSEGGAGTGNSGALTMSAGSTLSVGGTAAGALGSLTVNGTVSLGNAMLALPLPASFIPLIGTTLTLIDNDGVDVVSGTFAGLAEGGSIAVKNVVFSISYQGGSGNDVVLTVTNVHRDYLLSEGATGSFFTTDILLANPNDQPAPIHIALLKDSGATVTLDDTLPAQSHKLIQVNAIAGMEAAAFSTVVSSTSGQPIVVERTMSWDQSGYGAHTERATASAETSWYFAEGSQGFFHTYLLLTNPQPFVNMATVRFLREGEPPFEQSYGLLAHSRVTVDAATEPALLNRSFGMIVFFRFPGAAERAMYFGSSPLFNGGHESAGVTAPSTTWFLAEGATGPFFETFILLANPGATDARVTLTYLTSAGPPVTKVKTVPALGRVTVNLEGEDPLLTNAAVSTQVVSTQPILVERSQYWPDPAPSWYEAHNSFGVTTLGTKWGLAEGRVGGTRNAQTYILLANPGDTVANVTVTFLRDNGAQTVVKHFSVSPRTRFNVPVGPGTDVPELTNENFGALITSDQPIAVERALYWDANNQIWAAGTNATATPLP